MASEQSSRVAVDKEIQIPEWEHNAPKSGKEGNGNIPKPKRSLRDAFAVRLDAAMPTHRKYLGMKRNVFLWVLLAVFLALLALIIGLAVGLTHGGGKSSKNLPLPSDTSSFTGDLTYYVPGLGACGWTNTAKDDIVAVSWHLFDAAGSSSSTGGDSNSNPLCGLKIRAQRYNEEVSAMRSVDLTVVDRCTGCAATDIDTTLSAFEELAPEAAGRVDVTWAWLSPAPTGKM